VQYVADKVPVDSAELQQQQEQQQQQQQQEVPVDPSPASPAVGCLAQLQKLLELLSSPVLVLPEQLVPERLSLLGKLESAVVWLQCRGRAGAPDLDASFWLHLPVLAEQLEQRFRYRMLLAMAGDTLNPHHRPPADMETLDVQVCEG
jgi:hypothetical protein